METPLSLGDIVSLVESDGRSDALRFEPAVYARLASRPAGDPLMARIQRANGGIEGCSLYTAKMIASTSWGEYQCMGFNIYNIPWRPDIPSIAEFANSPSLQLMLFKQMVALWDINFSASDLKTPDGRLRFARFYNGPGNPQAYANRIADVMGVPRA